MGLSLAKVGLTIRPLSPLVSAIAQLFQAPNTEIRGIDNQNWFGPGQPVKPIAPRGTEPRGWQFFPNQNYIYTPRANDPLTGEQLREASMYDLVRIIIENVEDQITRMPINIRLRRLPGETGKEYAQRKPDKGIINAIFSIIDQPNPNETRAEFSRKLIDDMLVGDFASMLIRKTKKGEVQEVRAIDGALIARYIDANGFTPMPPDPAYAQLWYGIPMVDLTTQQLIYAPRNLKSYRLYGMPPVEQAIHYIRTGALRLAFQEASYTDGNIPDAMQVVPMGIPRDTIEETEKVLASTLAGQLNKRRQIKLVQGFTTDGKDQFIFPKAALLGDSFEDVVINALCFAFGTSKQRLMKMMNRASAEASQDAAEKEGLEPFLEWYINSIWNRFIQSRLYLNFTDYEATFQEDTDVDATKQAEIDKTYLSMGVRTLNEVRENLGDEPYNIPEADQPLIITPTGPIPIGIDQDIERSKKKQEAIPDAGNTPADGSTPKGSPTAAAKKRWRRYRASQVRKRHNAVIDPKRVSSVQHAVTRLETAVEKVFRRQKEKAKEHATRLMKARHVFRPAIIDFSGLRKADGPSPEEMFDEIWEAIVEDFADMNAEVREGLEDAVRDGINNGIVQLALTDGELIKKANLIAADYASNRAAALVGKRITESGELVDNPRAKWAIDDTTRDQLREIIKKSFEQETPYSDLIAQIEDASAFSTTRAQLVARTEVQTAQIKGNFEVWKMSGVVEKVQWLVNDEPCDECEPNDDVIVAIGEPFPSGDLTPLVHPRCECILIAIEVQSGDDE